MLLCWGSIKPFSKREPTRWLPDGELCLPGPYVPSALKPYHSPHQQCSCCPFQPKRYDTSHSRIESYIRRQPSCTGVSPVEIFAIILILLNTILPIPLQHKAIPSHYPSSQHAHFLALSCLLHRRRSCPDRSAFCKLEAIRSCRRRELMGRVTFSSSE